MYPLQLSTAIAIPFFLHDSSGNPVTGKVDGDFTKRIKKAGGAFAALTATVTEDEGGWYDLALLAGDADTLGILTAYLTVSGAKQVNLQFRVSARLFDDLLPTASYTAPDNATISAIALYVDTEVAAILAAVDTEVAAIKAKTDQLTFTGANKVDASVRDIEGADPTDQIRDSILTDATRFAGASVAAILAAVDTEVASILAAVDTEVAAIKAKTDQLVFTNTNKVDAAVVAAGDLAQAAADKVWDTTARTLTAFGFAGDVADAVWDEAQSGHTTAGTFGKYLDVEVASRLATAGYAAPPAVGDIADAVWDEAIAGHLAAGSTGAALNGAGAVGDPWSTALPGAYGAGTAGQIVGDRLDAAVASRLASADIALTGGKVTPVDADGMAYESLMTALAAAAFGITEVLAVDGGGNPTKIAFKRRDGATIKVTVEYGALDGERVDSVLA